MPEADRTEVELEKLINCGKTGFVEVGLAAEIRDMRRDKPEFKSSEARRSGDGPGRTATD